MKTKVRQLEPDGSASDKHARPEPTIVGIGASAGGLAALRALFDRVPEDSGIAFVVVVHLSPTHESHLADLLQPHLKIPVQQVTETVPLEPNHVYVIPPGNNLSAIDTHLRLSSMEEERRQRAPIDHFFRTLASTHDGDAAGVILSGTGSDGTLGVKEIKAKGGLVVVQDPNEAEYDGMPLSAIAAGVVDLVLPAAEIAQAIVRFSQTRPRVPALQDGQDIAGADRNQLHKVFAQLRLRTGRDFSRYKLSTILRRLSRRMQLSSIEDLPDYIHKLRERPEEATALADDLLITVTNFFRDNEVFEKLERDVIPKLFRGKTADDEMRVWTVGCATGEEAFSLAILLLEEAARQSAGIRVQIFASDMHDGALARARDGFYPGDIEADVSAERLKKFFEKENGGYRVRKEVRDLVVFAPHNVLGDPPFSRLDLVACRNLLIYLQREAQRDVIELFHYALRPDGYLILGTSEAIESSDLFRTEDKELRFYRKRNTPAVEPHLPNFLSKRGAPLAAARTGGRDGALAHHGLLHLRLAELYAPPSLLVSPDDKAAHLSEHAGRYIVHPGGQPTLNVFKLVRKELAVELRACLHDARQHRQEVSSKPIPVRFNGTARPVVLRVRPALEQDQEGFALVVFEEREPNGPAEPPGKEDGAPQRHPEHDAIAGLESELSISRQRLQSFIDEYESSREEMTAANEELHSVNEELRSTMEELETSKEELQSMNEELQTVNQENRHKVEELGQLSSDLQNLLNATNIATLFLDREMRILRFTPKAAEIVNVIAADRGRPLSDLRHRLGYDDLQADADLVLRRLTPVEREVRDGAGNWYIARILPYRSIEDRIAGVVVTFVDVTEWKRTQEMLRESEERFRLLVERAKEYAIFMLGLDGDVTLWSAGAKRLFGYGEQEVLGRSADFIFTREDREAGVLAGEMEKAAQEERAEGEGWRVRKDGSRFWGSGVLEAVRSEDGNMLCFLKILRDNSERKEMEDAQRRINETLETLVTERTGEVRQKEERIRDLASRLTIAEHEERHRIAQVLHDDLQQLLYSIRMKVMFLRGQADAGDRKELLQTADEAEQWISEALRVVHRLSVELSPHVLEKDGFNEALRWLGAQMTEQHGLEVEIDADEGIEMPRPMRVLLFQAVRELLFNVVKHAGVERAKIAVRADGDLSIQVSDQGKGFDVKTLEREAGFGMVTVRHRLSLLGGDIGIESHPDRGTKVTIRAPLESNAHG